MTTKHLVAVALGQALTLLAGLGAAAGRPQAGSCLALHGGVRGVRGGRDDGGTPGADYLLWDVGTVLVRPFKEHFAVSLHLDGEYLTNDISGSPLGSGTQQSDVWAWPGMGAGWQFLRSDTLELRLQAQLVSGRGHFEAGAGDGGHYDWADARRTSVELEAGKPGSAVTVALP